MDTTTVATNKIVDTKDALGRLQDAIATFGNSDNFRDFLKVQARFHTYSWRNSILIAMQCPEATKVAGFKTWANKLGRQVRKGEKSIKILAPRPFTKQDKEGNDQKGIYFAVVSVFDVSQTDPIPGAKFVYEPEKHQALPEITDDLGGDLLEVAVAYAREELNYTVQFEHRNGVNGDVHPSAGAKGWHSRPKREIYVSPGANLHKLAITIHEILHAEVDEIEKEEMEKFGYGTEEVIVQAATFIVLDHFGLDVTEFSAIYCHSWLQTDAKAFQKGLGRITKLAEKLINVLTPALPEAGEGVTEEEV